MSNLSPSFLPNDLQQGRKMLQLAEEQDFVSIQNNADVY